VIDTGLLVSVVALVAIPVVWSRFAGIRIDGERLTDAAIAPLVSGLLAARIATLLLDDPEALRSFKDASVIRGGVDFWPGIIVAVVVTAWGAHRTGKDPVERLAALVPFALVAYAVFEATCVVREGCFGPVSPLGFRPTGLQATMFPIGLVVAGVVAGTAIVIYRSSWSPAVRVWLAVGVVSAARAIASFWLPKIGDGLTRAHQWSLVVALLSTLVAAVLLVRQWRERSAAQGSGAHGIVDHGR